MILLNFNIDTMRKIISIFAVMGFVALVASCGPSGSKVVQKIGGSASKGAKTVKPLKSATKAGGGTSLINEAAKNVDNAARLFEDDK